MLHILSHVPGPVSTLAIMTSQSLLYCQLRVGTLFNCVPVRIRTVLTPTETLYSDSTLLVLNGLAVNSVNILLALNWHYNSLCSDLEPVLMS